MVAGFKGDRYLRDYYILQVTEFAATVSSDIQYSSRKCPPGIRFCSDFFEDFLIYTWFHFWKLGKFWFSNIKSEIIFYFLISNRKCTPEIGICPDFFQNFLTFFSSNSENFLKIWGSDYLSLLYLTSSLTTIAWLVGSNSTIPLINPNHE